MSHLQRPQGQRLGILAAALVVTVGLGFGAHAQVGVTPQLVDINAVMAKANIKLDDAKVRDFGNWNNCLDYKISGGMYWCPGFFFFIPTVPYPAPCIDFDYREPTSVIEVTCSGNSNVEGTFNFGTIFGGSNKKEPQQNCVTNIKTDGGQYSRAFNHAIARSATGPASRLATSANPVQVAQSYTCGVLGAAGNMDMLANLQNFNLGELLSPATWGSALQSGAQTLQTSAGALDFTSMFSNLGDMVSGSFDAIANSIAGIGTSLQQMATDFMTSLQTSFASLQSTLQGLMSGTLLPANLNSAELGTMAQNFLGIGDVMGATGAVGGDGNLLNAAIGATSAGNALQTLSLGNFTPEQGASLAESVQAALNLGLQSFGGGTQSAGKDTFYATHFTPAHFAQSSGGTMVADPNAGPKNPPNAGYASWSFLPTVEKGADGKLKATGFLKDGQSQVALSSVQLTISTTLGWMDGISKIAATEGLNTILNTDAAGLCSFQSQIRGGIAVVKELGDKVASTTSPSQFLPYGTYLNATQPQVVLASQPVASCPLTHAGFRARLDNPAKLEAVNCTSVCTGGGDSPRVCKIVPKSGFAGSCFSNALSVQKEEGHYPACNGQKPTRVADGKGGWRTVGQQYDATLDHHTKINDIYRNRVLKVQATTLARLQDVDRQLTAKIQSLGGACTALGNPVGKEFIAYQPLPASNQSAAVGAAAPGNAQVAGANMAGGLATMTKSIDNALILAQMGPDNLVASQIARTDPGILPVVFNSNAVGAGIIPMSSEAMNDRAMASMWETGVFNPDGFINGTFASLNGGAYGMAELVGCASKLGLDMVSAPTQATYTECWGDVRDMDGWSFAKIEPLQKAVVAARTHRVAQATGAIPVDTSKKGNVFNTEGTGKRQEATTQGMPALGGASGKKASNSKCYAEGTLNPGFYTPGDTVIPVESMLGAIEDSFDWKGSKTDSDDGSMVFTYWKNTKCCIPPTCPQNIHQIY